MTYIFEPPTPADTPPFLPDSTGAQVGLWRHYKPRRRGVNVFLLNNGEYVQTTATPTLTEMTNVAGHLAPGPQPPWEPSTALETPNVPYPWNPYTPNAPYVHIQNWTGTVTTVTLTPRIIKVYYGGHTNPITEEEAASLIAAGYGTCIREAS